MRAKLLKRMIGIRKGENLRNEETEKFYVVKTITGRHRSFGI
jgi:hypothetical protein